MKHIVIEGLHKENVLKVARYLSQQVTIPFFDNEGYLAVEKCKEADTLDKLTEKRRKVLRKSSTELSLGKTVFQAGFILRTAAEYKKGSLPYETLDFQKNQFPLPDLTILIDSPGNTKTEKTVRKNYHKLLANSTVHSVVINGTRSLSEIKLMAAKATIKLLSGQTSDLEEAVFCVPRKILQKAGLLAPKEGMIPSTPENLEAFKKALNHGIWIERALAEENTSFKQIIPFVAVLNPTGELSYYIRKGKDARLHDQLSVGVSGHINPEDSKGAGIGGPFPGWDIVLAGTMREIEEELGSAAEGIGAPEVIGFINDEINPVGRVHLGIAMTASSPKPLELFRSTELGIMKTASIETLSTDERAESWTRTMLKALQTISRKNPQKTQVTNPSKGSEKASSSYQRNNRPVQCNPKIVNS